MFGGVADGTHLYLQIMIPLLNNTAVTAALVFSLYHFFRFSDKQALVALQIILRLLCSILIFFGGILVSTDTT